MTILSWNIQQGGGSRLLRIIEEISAYDADLVALTEYRVTPGAVLCAAMKDRGFAFVETTSPAGNQNGIAVFSRTPMVRTRFHFAPADSLARWLDIDLPDCRFGIGVLHIMAAGSSPKAPENIAKARFWDAVLEAAKARLDEPFLLIGDWNTGAHGLDEVGKTFFCAERFERLSAMGWTDLWRHHHSGTTEWTWYSRFKGGARGNGFRLDHAFATPSFSPRVVSCHYSHAERDAGVSDHSLVIVEVE